MKKGIIIAITIILAGIILFFIVPWDNFFSTTESENSLEDDNKYTKKDGFQIIIDEERYKWSEKQENVLVPKEPLDERYPEVSMKIEHFPSSPHTELLPELEEQMKETYSNVSEPESILEPVKGIKLHGIDQEDGLSNWDSPVSNIYVLDNGEGGSLVITEKYFLEAAEGHGANFYHMLETLEIIVKTD